MFFAEGFVEQAGGKALVLGNFFVAYGADSFKAGFAVRVAVRAAHNDHQLVGNVHGTINFGNKVFAYKK